MNKLTTKIVVPKHKFFTWQKGKYIKCDGIFTEVLYKRGNVWKVKKVNSKKEFYLVSNGDKYSHGDTIKEAKADLLFKISDRNKSDFNHLKLDSVLTFEAAIECYRVITGACSTGTKFFVNEKLQKQKKKYAISEIVELTKGQYGNKEFTNFFNK